MRLARISNQLRFLEKTHCQNYDAFIIFFPLHPLTSHKDAETRRSLSSLCMRMEWSFKALTALYSAASETMLEECGCQPLVHFTHQRASSFSANEKLFERYKNPCKAPLNLPVVCRRLHNTPLPCFPYCKKMETSSNWLSVSQGDRDALSP